MQNTWSVLTYRLLSSGGGKRINNVPKQNVGGRVGEEKKTRVYNKQQMTDCISYDETETIQSVKWDSWDQ